MKLVSGSLLVTLVSTTAFAAAPQEAGAPAPAAVDRIAASRAAHTITPERLDLARQFVNATMSGDEYTDTIRASALQAASEAVVNNADASDTPADKVMADVQKVVDRLEPPMRAQLPKLLDAYAQAYAREFSADELRSMVAFAQSPAGRHYTRSQGFLMGDRAIVQAQMDMMESMEPVLQDLRKQACQRHTQERIAMGDTKATCPLAKAAETQQG